ncbi:glucosidase family protein [Flavitalea flava]
MITRTLMITRARMITRTRLIRRARLLIPLFFAISLLEIAEASFAQAIHIKNDPQAKTIAFGNGKIKLIFEYDKKANISLLEVNGQRVIEGDAGVYSQISIQGTNFSTLHLTADPIVKVKQDSIFVTGIIYGNKELSIKENWTFSLTGKDIKFDMERTLNDPLDRTLNQALYRALSGSVTLDKAAFPVFNFQDTASWDGAYQDYGGLAWFYLFNKKLDTYGVHSHSSRFWNSRTDNGLTVSVEAPGNQVAMDYSRTAANQLAFTIGISPKEMLPRLDSGTQRRRYIRDATAVWAPFAMAAGKTSQSITLSWFSVKEQFGRGNFVGINGEQVSSVLNTIARIGVIDKEHFGGNSWHTPYGPICLHEQYIAQIGLAINDSNYLNGYQQCLDFYRDNAFKPDGRVWARWAYNDEDMMPGEANAKGFYEAQWGYLLDANPDLVTNVAELYDQTGNIDWVRTHQLSCEKALDWILKRDGNNNGLVEMITDSHLQKRGSDWLDIIWASYENAFVNAKLYHALVLWAAIEGRLGNREKEKEYLVFAQKLKTSFNRTVRDGGFWDDETKCYIHWRDKDGSAHGNNMVTPVNFMAIAYGICEDDSRRKTILDKIETQMQNEKLFFWPVCMNSYRAGEGNDWQFPFPNYENGDLFLSWGAVGVKAYADYKPELAVKYVKNVLAQYAKDGLAFQRYGRVKQDGLGDDILSGNSLSVVGLYQAVYGINPLYNRFYLNPHITPELAGTRINYTFRGRKLTISLDMDKYRVSDNRFTIISKTDFGFYSSDSTLLYFQGSSDKASLSLITSDNSPFSMDVKEWSLGKKVWTQSSNQHMDLSYELYDLKHHTEYKIYRNKDLFMKARTNADGTLLFPCKAHKKVDEILISE